MGRPPQGGGPAFRFTQNEVVEMETCLQDGNNAMPSREVIGAFAEKFSSSSERLGKIPVQPKQVWNWFQNRRHAHRAKAYTSKIAAKPGSSQFHHEESSISFRNPPAPGPSASVNSGQMEFEAKSARDGAWYDVAAFLSHRLFETGDPEVRVRFSGFGTEEDEWVNVRKCVRQRSLPCESAECVAVLPNDLILCFQEGKEQALYFDAHVLDAQRRRHDVRGCRCRFLVRYDHDLSEEIVPLRKVCRRPDSDYRLQILQASRLARPMDHHQSSGPHVSVMDNSLTHAAPLHKMATARNNTEENKATPEKSSASTVDGGSEDSAGAKNHNTILALPNDAIEG